MGQSSIFYILSGTLLVYIFRLSALNRTSKGAVSTALVTLIWIWWSLSEGSSLPQASVFSVQMSISICHSRMTSHTQGSPWPVWAAPGRNHCSCCFVLNLPTNIQQSIWIYIYSQLKYVFLPEQAHLIYRDNIFPGSKPTRMCEEWIIKKIIFKTDTTVPLGFWDPPPTGLCWDGLTQGPE